MKESTSNLSAPNPNEQIFAVLIALVKDSLLLPNLAISEVVSRDSLKPLEGMPAWFAGMVTVSGRDLPVLRFESLNAGEVEESGRRTRVAIINGVSRQLPAGRFGVICEGYPHLVTLNRMAMRAIDLRAKDNPQVVASRVRVASVEAAIPDLAHIENELANLIASLAATLPAA